MSEFKFIKGVDVGFDGILITDLEWLSFNGFHELIFTGKFDETDKDFVTAILSLNGEELDLEEKLIIPFISNEIGDNGVEAVVNYIEDENIFRIWTDIHDNNFERPIVYAKRIKA